ncbi:MAG: glutaredoxin [Nitrospirae bacterium]|nr:MAG: glutaredoxin [Nitrospirota bacterium]
MRSWLIFLTAIILLSIFISPASSEIYKWKDKDGNIFYSDSPPAGIDVQKKKFREDRIERQETKESSHKSENNTLKENKPYSDVEVVMYMTSWCGYCKKAREYINSLGVRLTEYDVERDKSKNSEMLSKSGGYKGVPLIDVEGVIIRGYVPDAIKTAVEKSRSL